MNLVDSSGWLEYFADGNNAKHFAPVINDTDRLIVSTINIYEVHKKVISERDEDDALQAAKISYLFKLPMADCLIYITAREQNAIIWTQDADFKDLEGVKYFKKSY